MEYTYAALLLHKVGKDINEDNLKAVISATGAEVDEAKVKVMVAKVMITSNSNFNSNSKISSLINDPIIRKPITRKPKMTF